MNNEQRFFKELQALEPVEYSAPLTKKEREQIFWDIANGHYAEPYTELVKRIEYAHGIGVKHARTKAG